VISKDSPLQTAFSEIAISCKFSMFFVIFISRFSNRDFRIRPISESGANSNQGPNFRNQGALFSESGGLFQKSGAPDSEIKGPDFRICNF
jgi:hypothetical protein